MKVNNKILTEEEGMKYFEDIIGYDYVKQEMVKRLNVYRYLESCEDIDKSKKGVAFVGEEEVGKKFMAEKYARLLNRSVMIFNCEPTVSQEEDSFISDAERAASMTKEPLDKLALVIYNVDGLRLAVLRKLLAVVNKLCADVYTIVTITNEESDSAQECFNELTPFRIRIGEPDKKDSEAFLEYFVNHKYKNVVFEADIDDLMNIFANRHFARIDRVFQNSVLEAASYNKNVSVKQLVFEMMHDKNTINKRYPFDKRIQVGVHEAGHLLMAAKLEKENKGFGFISGLCGRCITVTPEEIVCTEAVMNRNLINLAGLVAEKVCFGTMRRGSEEDLIDVNNYILRDMVNQGMYGLKYAMSCIGEDQKDMLDRKVQEILEEVHREAFETLVPYKELLLQIGEILACEGYILLPEVRRLLAEFDKNRG